MKSAENALRRVEGQTNTSSSKVARDLDRTRSHFTSLNSTILKLAAGGAAVAFFKSSVDAASSFNEQLNKTRVVFGESSKSVEQFAKGAVRDMGLSQRAVFEATGTFGNLFRAMGIGLQPAADMSKGLVKLSADLASFNEANTEDVLLALRSGLVGEVEPLRKFGVSLSAARVEQEALRLGLAKTTKELTPAIKAQVAYSIILQDTKIAQGDFARTSDSLANKQKKLNASYEETRRKLGEALVPTMKVLTEAATKFNEILSALPGPIVAVGVGALGAVVGVVLLSKAFRAVGTELAIVRARLKGLGGEFVKEGATANIGGGLFRGAAGRGAGAVGSAAGGIGSALLSPVGLGAITIASAVVTALTVKKAFFDAPKGFDRRDIDAITRLNIPDTTPAVQRNQSLSAASRFAGAELPSFEIDKQLADATDSLRQFQTVLTGTGTAVFSFAAMTGATLQKWTEDRLSNFKNVEGILGTLADKANLTSDDILGAFQKQLKELRVYDTNWDKLIARGAPEEMLKQLQDMGLQGAPVVKALANASDKEFHRIQVAMGLVHKEARDIVTSVRNIQTGIDALPEQKKINIAMHTAHIRDERDAFGNPIRTPSSSPSTRAVVNVYIRDKVVDTLVAEVSTRIGRSATVNARTQ